MKLSENIINRLNSMITIRTDERQFDMYLKSDQLNELSIGVRRLENEAKTILSNENLNQSMSQENKAFFSGFK